MNTRMMWPKVLSLVSMLFVTVVPGHAFCQTLTLARFLSLSGKSFVDGQGKLIVTERLGVAGAEKTGLPLEARFGGSQMHSALPHQVIQAWIIPVLDACAVQEDETRLSVLLPTGDTVKLTPQGDHEWTDGDYIGTQKGNLFSLSAGENKYLFKNGLIEEMKNKSGEVFTWHRANDGSAVVSLGNKRLLQVARRGVEKTEIVLETPNGSKTIKLGHDVQTKVRLDNVQPRLHSIWNEISGEIISYDWSEKGGGTQLEIARESMSGRVLSKHVVLYDAMNKVLEMDGDRIYSRLPDSRFHAPLVTAMGRDGVERLVHAGLGSEGSAILKADLQGITQSFYAFLPNGESVLRKVVQHDKSGEAKILYSGSVDSKGKIIRDSSNGYDRVFNGSDITVSKNSTIWSRYTKGVEEKTK